MPPTEFEYIRIIKIRDTGKTTVWFSENKKHGSHLGSIKWYGPWRQYVFWPAPATIFSAGCLKDINTFITQAMTERKKK